MVRRLIVSGLLVTSPLLAQGQKASATIDWARKPGAEQCIDAQALARAVEARLQRPVFTAPGRGDAVVRGTVEPRAKGGWAATIELRSADGRFVGVRELSTDAEHCSAFDDSLALVLALLVDVEKKRVAAAPQPPATQPPAPDKPRVRERVKIEVPKEAHAPRLPWFYELGAIGAASFGILPDPELGLGALAALDPPHFPPVVLSATFFRTQRTARPPGRASFSLVLASFELCPVRAGSGRVSLDGCIRQRAGRLESVGTGFDDNGADDRLYIDFGLSADGALVLAGPLELFLSFGGSVPLTRDRFIVEGPSETRQLHRSAAVVGDVGVGLKLRL